MAAAWVTNFFISVHPLLEAVFYQSDTLKTSPFVSEMKPEKIPFMSEQQENDDPPECKYALNQLKCVDLPSGAYFCELDTSKCLTRGTMHVSYSFISCGSASRGHRCSCGLVYTHGSVHIVVHPFSMREAVRAGTSRPGCQCVGQNLSSGLHVGLPCPGSHCSIADSRVLPHVRLAS